MGASCGILIRRDCSDIDSSWIVFNQPKPDENLSDISQNKHAGFLLGIGLMGHLRKMAHSDALRYYLLPQNEMLSIGLLLGLGSSFFGKRDHGVTDIISVHIPAMLPPNSASLNTASFTRTAAVVAYGLVHFGSKCRQSTHKLMNEMSQAKFAELDPENLHTECYIAGCGFALVCGFNLGVHQYTLGGSRYNEATYWTQQ